MGTGEFNAGGNPAMDLHSIQGGVERWKYSWSLYAIETGISSSWINHSYIDFTFYHSTGHECLAHIMLTIVIRFKNSLTFPRLTK